MTDMHIHTRYSFDSEEEPASYIRAAINCGEVSLGFAEHYDYDAFLDGEKGQLADMQGFIAEIDRMLEHSPVKIFKGVELGYRAKAVKKYREIEKLPLDFIIMSVHTLKGRGDCYFPEFYKGLTKEQAYGKYLDAVYDSITCGINFHILGHLGYVARYAPYEDRKLTYEEFPDRIDRILKALIERHISLELNASCKGLEGPFVTDVSILDRYIELGGEDFTYGSDAHKAADFQRGAQAAEDFLISHGMTHINLYEGRRAIAISLI
ncbi:MAG: histidinol-phosphatase HisJ family protein [Clostridia bacterium]|nr:histidinol-phosphatase HisJ family protein [Clostridia bacterium]